MLRSFLLLTCLLISIPSASAAQQVDVALISDGEVFQLREIQEALTSEFDELAEGEFDVNYIPFTADWTLDGIEQAFNEAYANQNVDLVLAVGFASNQVGVVRDSFPKPTFLPLVFDAEFLRAPRDGDRSGKSNLSYLTDRIHFKEHLGNLRRVAPYQELTLLTDEIVLAALPEALRNSIDEASDLGVSLSFIGHDGADHSLSALIDESADAVVIGGLPRMPDESFQALINEINHRQLPSFSLIGTEPVELGVLASDAPSKDWGRLSRRNALSMQAVLLGERAQDQPILFESNQQLTMNMRTARQIGLSPRFDVLSEATLLYEIPDQTGPVLDLATVARLSLQRNRDLAAEIAGVSAAATDIDVARSARLPQVDFGGSYSARKQTPITQSGQFAERSSDLQLGFSQVIWSDDVSANIEIQNAIQAGREHALHAFELDIVQQSTQAYLTVLQAETQVRVRQDNLRLTRSNLELARDRVAIGSASSADLYRWQSREASDRATLLQAKASLSQAQDGLRRLLHWESNAPFQLKQAELADPFAFTREEFDGLINNFRTLGLLYEYMVVHGVDRSPELMQLDEQIAAKEREILNLKRDYWAPDLALSGSSSSNLGQTPSGGLGDELNDWNVMVSASIPIFSGGARKADQSRASFELEQLQLTRSSISEKVEQRIRSALHFTGATYNNIDLSRTAADAAAANLELITDSYSKGLVSIIELLDAQNASLQAAESAANAIFEFLINVVDLQRAAGQYDFLLPPDELAREAQRLSNFILSGGQSLP